VKFTRRTRIVVARPDAIPIVNVALLLLLFFIVAMRFAQDPGVAIQLPDSSAATVFASPHPPLIITITASTAETPQNFIFFNDERMDLRRLEHALAESARQASNRDCYIKADKSAPHGLVVNVMSLAHRAGFKSVRIATQPSTNPAAP
jgi:biopolymer transport protein ExbD